MKIIAIDLDDTLCFRDSEEGGVQKYLSCKPIPEMVEVVNQCYDWGYEIVIYTARGMSVFKGNKDNIIHSLYELTKGQLEEWGIKHHKLVMGKLHYDLLVDDKAVSNQRIKSVEDIKGMVG